MLIGGLWLNAAGCINGCMPVIAIPSFLTHSSEDSRSQRVWSMHLCFVALPWQACHVRTLTWVSVCTMLRHRARQTC